VRDAAGQEVPAFLAVAEDTVTVYLWEPEEPEEEGELQFPIVAYSEIASSSSATASVSYPPYPHCKANAHKPYMRKNINIYGELTHWSLLWGAAMNCVSVAWMKITTEMERRYVALFIVHWDTVDGYTFEKDDEGSLPFRAGGGYCEETKSAHSFRTVIRGQAIATVNQNPACLIQEFGQCRLSASDTSATSRYRCANG
jgi:hypothetical protein